MNYQNLLLKTENGVCTVTINRPEKMNALNRVTLSELKFAFEKINNDPEVKGVIITGAGEKAFVAGADISEFQNIDSAEHGRAFAENGQRIFQQIENCLKPVIAAVNGYALGGGCELAMSCHLRVASQHAKFGQPEVNLGLIPGYGGTQRLVRYIGKTKATELLLTADMFTADDAFRMGLVNYVTSSEQLIPKCMEILEKIKTKSPVTTGFILKTVNAYYKKGVDGFTTELDEFGNCFKTDDFKEGTQAFLEKRKANFKGK